MKYLPLFRSLALLLPALLPTLLITACQPSDTPAATDPSGL